MFFIISLNAGISFTINNDSKILSRMDSIIPNSAYFVISSLSFVHWYTLWLSYLRGCNILPLNNKENLPPRH